MNDVPLQDAPAPSPTRPKRSLIKFFEWEGGKSRQGDINSIDELEGPQNWNLKILCVEIACPFLKNKQSTISTAVDLLRRMRRLCPRDYEDSFPPGGLNKLCQLFDIPAEFRSERASNVSYSFGQNSQKGGTVNGKWHSELHVAFVR